MRRMRGGRCRTAMEELLLYSNSVIINSQFSAKASYIAHDKISRPHLSFVLRYIVLKQLSNVQLHVLLSLGAYIIMIKCVLKRKYMLIFIVPVVYE